MLSKVTSRGFRYFTFSTVGALLCGFITIYSCVDIGAYARSTAVIEKERSYEILEKASLKDVLRLDLLNLQSHGFPKDFEIEVTNLTKKPIYGIKLVVLFPESKQVTALTLGVRYGFGRHELVDIEKLSEEGDASIEPGVTVRLKRNMEEVDGLIRMLNSYSFNPSEKISKVILTVQAINFGDGTGYVAGDAVPRSQQK